MDREVRGLSERRIDGLHLRRQFLDMERPAVEQRYRQFRWVRYSAAALGLVAVLLALAGAVGRATGVYWFASFLPGYKPMTIAVAVTLVLLAGIVWALTLPARQPFRVVRALSGVVIALALLRLIEYAAGADWDVSMLFLSGVLPPGQPQPYYSIPGALAAITIALSTILYTVRSMRLVGLIAAVFGTALATIVLFGWAFGVPLWGGSSLSPVALPAAIALWCVGSALVIIGVAWELALRALIEERREEDRLELQRQATEMQAQRDLLRDMVTYAPAGMVLFDGRDLRVRWFNDAYRQIQNPQYHQTDLVGMRVHDFQPGVEESGVGDILRSVARGEFRQFSEYEYQHFERGLTYFNWVNVPVPRADAEDFDILVMVIEITDQVLARKRVEALAEEARLRAEELDAQRRQLQAITGNTPAALIFFDGQDLTVKWHNRRYTQVLDRRFHDQDLTGLHLTDFVPTAEAEGVAEPIRRAAGGELLRLPEFIYHGFERGTAYFNWVAVPVQRSDGRGYDVLVMTSDITEQVESRKRVEALTAEMQVQRDLVQAIIENVTVGVLLVDGKTLQVKLHNNAYTHFLDEPFHDRDLTGMHLEEFTPGLEESGAPDLYLRTAAGERLAVTEWEYPGFERGVTYWDWSIVPLPRADGDGYDPLATITEVTEQVRARRQIEALGHEAQRRAAELDTVIDSIADGVIVYGAGGELLRMNESMRRLLGYTGEEERFPLQERIERLDFRDAEGRSMEYSDSPAVRALRGETVRGHVVTMHYGTPQQTTSLYSGAPLYDDGGQIMGAVITVADVTALRRTEEALRRSEAVLKRAQEIAHLGSWELDLRKNELIWSDEVYRIFGLQPQAFPGTYEAFLDHVHPDDREAVDEAYRGSIREGRDLYEIEHRVVRAGTGEVRFVHERGEHARDADGQIIRSIGMVHDITERKQAEEELHRYRSHLEELVEQRTDQLQQNQRRLRALATDLVQAEQRERQRVAGLLHDEVAQTLGALKMQLAVLRMKCPEATDELGSSITMAEDAVKQTRGIMTELSPPVLQRFGLVKAVHWWGEVLHERHGLKVAVTAPDGTVGLDDVMQTALFQAIKELLQNVAKHAGVSEASVQIGCGEGVVRVSVTDNGVGFEPGEVTTTDRGGFGLFSIKERFAHLGGNMEISSAPGQGTTVKLALPVSCEVSDTPTDTPTQQPPA